MFAVTCVCVSLVPQTNGGPTASPTFSPTFTLVHSTPAPAFDSWQMEKIVDAGADWKSWDTSAVSNLGSSGAKYYGVVFVDTTQKLYFCPYYANNVLVVDP